MSKRSDFVTESAFVDPSQLPIVFRSQNESAAERERISLDTAQPGGGECAQPTRQEEKDDADIRTILRRNGIMPPERVPLYGVTVEYGNGILESYLQLETAFESLPESVQARFSSASEFARAVARGQVEFVPVVPEAVVTPEVPKA